MKLLQVGCFAATAVRAQEGSGQDVDYTLDETRGDYEYEYDEFGNKKKNKKNQASYSPPVYSPPSYNTYNYQDDYYGKAYATDATVAYALNCWPANFDTDKLVYNDGTNEMPYEKYATGPLHYYGSEKKGLTNAVDDANSPAAGANNRGGLYHYGWENGASTGSAYKENAAPSGWVHYHSARHAGCLYELAGFDYSSTTYSKIFDAHYYNGYYLSASPFTPSPAVVDTDISYVPNWVHFFNAHLLAGGDIDKSTAPDSTDRYSGTTQSAKRNARVVIANPQYEGLGYLNFIATYRVSGKTTGEHYQEFIDMTEQTTTFTDAEILLNTYNKINQAANGQHTDGISGEWFFDGWMGTWSFTNTGDDWFSGYTETDADAGTWAADLVAISSFPHNELGKDFRFNLRILQKADAATEESYYWYKVNDITITFPQFVSYALHNDYKRDASGIGAAANSILSPAQANQMMNVVNSEERVNIIPPLDIGTWDDVNFLREEDWVRGSETNGPKYNRINGYLGTATADATAAEWCTGTDAADENFCSKTFKIVGLMNTYDHHFAAQKGNLQEVWIQLSYAMRDNTIVAHSAEDEDYVVESPFPYLHFHATEISSIALSCTTTGVFNGNKCDGSVQYHHTSPAEDPNNHAFGG